ncbi:ribonuclease E/G [Phenylobacterium deserti]|uniref:Ribonuclease E/G n=1 Tax=Phenylobacterium deserti TaxID=1914756 RepID=A0A328ADM9_9CAUL|nr:ribonuclease E/G [Phenylobacterium deserti]RAK52607.1 ribonuclease E/G [Phenylobacterium deserti]
MSERRAFLDRSVGETRGVVTIDDRPERLLIRRDGDDPRTSLGARLVARVASVESALATAFLDLGGAEAILPFRPDQRPIRGASVEVEIRAEARRGKLPIARLVGPGEGEPRLLAPPPTLEEALRSYVRDGDIEDGRLAREVADEAEAEVLEVLHPLPGGGVLAIEPTRALTAIDVDLGERKGADAKRVARQANLAALATAARLLRLKGLGGIVVLDLVGRGHDGNALLAAARTAFGPDNPGVAIGAVGRFGTMELSLPRRVQPLAERLCTESGALTPRTVAQRLVRLLETEGASNPGARLEGRCAPEVAIEASPLVRKLGERLGARFNIVSEPTAAREFVEVRAI